MFASSNVKFCAEDDAEFARMTPFPAPVARWQAFNNSKKSTPYLMVARNLHIGLFRPAFNDFHSNMTSTERIGADAQTCASIRSLSAAFSKIYSSKEEWLAAIAEFMLIG